MPATTETHRTLVFSAFSDFFLAFLETFYSDLVNRSGVFDREHRLNSIIDQVTGLEEL